MGSLSERIPGIRERIIPNVTRTALIKNLKPPIQSFLMIKSKNDGKYSAIFKYKNRLYITAPFTIKDRKQKTLIIQHIYKKMKGKKLTYYDLFSKLDSVITESHRNKFAKHLGTTNNFFLKLKKANVTEIDGNRSNQKNIFFNVP